MKVLYRNTETVIEIDPPVEVNRNGGGSMLASQARVREDGDGDVTVSFGGYPLTKRGEVHKTASFRWFYTDDEQAENDAYEFVKSGRVPRCDTCLRSDGVARHFHDCPKETT